MVLGLNIFIGNLLPENARLHFFMGNETIQMPAISSRFFSFLIKHRVHFAWSVWLQRWTVETLTICRKWSAVTQSAAWPPMPFVIRDPTCPCGLCWTGRGKRLSADQAWHALPGQIGAQRQERDAASALHPHTHSPADRPVSEHARNIW